jgi:Domain of unknown function (DUF6647)
MEALMTAIATWLTLNFALPVAPELPKVAQATPEQMVQVRLQGREAPAAAAAAEIEALYDDTTRTIYLRGGWSPDRPRDVSVLVHEMVHHLQNAAGMRFECPQARERMAYAAQRRWLERHGQDLLEEFQLDPMTVLLRTRCMHG